MLILNIKNHIRKGEEIDVSGWQKESILRAGFELVEKISVPVTGLGFGANADKRVEHEEIFVFQEKGDSVKITTPTKKADKAISLALNPLR